MVLLYTDLQPVPTQISHNRDTRAIRFIDCIPTLSSLLHEIKKLKQFPDLKGILKQARLALV
jgi:hypothetical protein